MADSQFWMAWHPAWNRPFANRGSEIDFSFLDRQDKHQHHYSGTSIIINDQLATPRPHTSVGFTGKQIAQSWHFGRRAKKEFSGEHGGRKLIERRREACARREADGNVDNDNDGPRRRRRVYALHCTVVCVFDSYCFVGFVSSAPLPCEDETHGVETNGLL
ncbi:hypothetical protein DFP73DRAFT_591563 [Morchella snyderi]|nr:hypothetical protein DFP73DRAFT_591563 [Morchella snyderi]